MRTRSELQIGIVTVIGLAVVLSIAGSLVWAAPGNPAGFEVVGSSRRNTTFPTASVEAIAGNVTELRITSTTTTKTWAGYYGNVTGTIVLDDALNNSMFSWNLDEAAGEVYAARGSVDFSSGNIICANATHIQQEENNLSVSPTAKDGVNETFAYTTHPAFMVGDASFSSDQCGYTASTYVNDGVDSSRTFNETLLYDKADNLTVYMALLTSKQDGFKIGTDKYDFQMLVGEDGHGNTDTTTYYFYVELQ
ncbi:MAG: hypothetical protein GXP63_01750 [DPANN group archaeon]|nr:hypothetical protein [DPANN group archaeon]